MNRVRRLLDALGPAGVAGLGVLAFCAAFHFVTQRPAERAYAARIAGVEQRRAASGVRPVSADDATPQLARFHASFPPATGLADQLEEIHQLARRSRVELRQAEYRWEGRGTGLVAYRIVLPVQGSYAQLRSLVGRLLERMPSLSLDALRFERKKATDARLEAQIRVTLYMRESDAGGI